MNDLVIRSQSSSLLDGPPEGPEEDDLPEVDAERKYPAILDKDGNNGLIQSALMLMDRASGTPDAIKAKEAGLKLMQLGLAELQALRIARYATTAIQLEERLYSIESIRELKKPSQVAEQLAQLNGSLKESVHFVQNVMGKLKLDPVIAYLAEMAETRTGANAEAPEELGDFSKIAQGILEQLSAGKGFEEILGGGEESGTEPVRTPTPAPMPVLET